MPLHRDRRATLHATRIGPPRSDHDVVLIGFGPWEPRCPIHNAFKAFYLSQPSMKSPAALLLIALVAYPAASVGQRRDQRSAFDARRSGRLLPMREIERRVVPTMPGADYLGFDFDGGSGVYTMKFLRDGSVIWVEVDGRSGQILGRTGR